MEARDYQTPPTPPTRGPRAPSRQSSRGGSRSREAPVMAESGGLASELYPTGTAVSRPSSLRPGPQTPAHADGPDPPTNTLLPEGLKVQVSRDPPKEDSLARSSGSGCVEQACAQVAPHRTSAGPPLEPGVGPRTTVKPHGTAQTHTSTHLHQGVTSGTNNGLHVGIGGGGGGGISSVVGGGGSGGGGGFIQSLQPASLPAQSPSGETDQVEVCGHHAQKAQGQVVKPAPQPERCTTLAAAHHHDAAGRPTQLLQGGPVHMCAPRGGNASEDCVVMENHRHHHHHHHRHHHQHHQQQQCEEPTRYGSYSNHSVLEDRFTTCCHAQQPLLTPAQPPPLCVADAGAACEYQAAVPALPRLISSVSETGLDAERLLGCCSLSCSWVSPAPFPPGGGGFRSWTEECHRASSHPAIPAIAATVTAAIRDAGTMTAPREVRDVGVQTSLLTPPHVFPRVRLAEEGAAGTATGHQDGVGAHGAKRGSLKSPVKEVKWDAEGMTWEVYGASVDPEELGLAIQRHLELQIKETASRAAKLSRQGTATSRHSCAGASGKECGKKRGRVTLGSFRPPACCARTTTAVD